MKNKVLVTGANGLLGQKVVQVFLEGNEIMGLGRDHNCVENHQAYTYTRCDITDKREVKRIVREFKPDIIINSAAYTNVDGCEDDRDNCWKVNMNGAENVAQAAASVGAFLIHVSTDYVFDGEDGKYDEESLPNPRSYYGRAKLAGENAVIISRAEYAIVRTMILYGTGKNINANFATWLVEKLSKNEPVKIVMDQIGHPTLVDDLALAIRRIVELKKTGIYHVVGSECINRYDFALKLDELFNFDQKLISPIETKDLKQKAPRPLNCSFNLKKIKQELGIEMSGVEKGLIIFKRQLSELKSNQAQSQNL